MLATFLDGRVIIKVGDLTQEDTDAIVNAANWTLLGGGGVDGAIHRAGGPAVLEECRRIRAEIHPKGLPTGEAVITTAGEMPSRYVIHTVGPIYGEDRREAELLARCYENSLRLAVDHSLSSIAFPSISTGVFAYPKDEAAAVASTAIELHLLSSKASVDEVRLVFFSASDAELFLAHHRFEA